jgi:ribonuclease HI
MWTQRKGKHMLFVDGDFRCNLRVTRDGGVFRDPKGTERITFSWGLGNATNNHIESLALFLRLRLMNFEGYKNIVVIGDSEIVIKATRECTEKGNKNIDWNISRIQIDNKI